MELPVNIAEYPLVLALGMLGWYVVRYFLQREDKKEELREKKDLAHIEALKTIQSGVVSVQQDLSRNWAVTEELSESINKMSENMNKTTEALSNLQCLQKINNKK